MTKFSGLTKKIAFLSIIILLGCSKSDINNGCVSNIQASVASVTGPDIITAGQTISLDISFDTYNFCGKFDHFEETSTGTTKTISLFAGYKGCVCLNGPRKMPATYEFSPTQPGIYTFRFLMKGSNYLIHTVVVQ